MGFSPPVSGDGDDTNGLRSRELPLRQEIILASTKANRRLQNEKNPILHLTSAQRMLNAL